MYFQTILNKGVKVIYTGVYDNFFLDKYWMEKVANATTLTELMGIRMAAISGDKVPCTAKNNPIKLYRNEMIKLIFTTFIAECVNFRKSNSPENFDDSMMPSQAGEKL